MAHPRELPVVLSRDEVARLLCRRPKLFTKAVRQLRAPERILQTFDLLESRS